MFGKVVYSASESTVPAVSSANRFSQLLKKDQADAKLISQISQQQQQKQQHHEPSPTIPMSDSAMQLLQKDLEGLELMSHYKPKQSNSATNLSRLDEALTKLGSDISLNFDQITKVLRSRRDVASASLDSQVPSKTSGKLVVPTFSEALAPIAHLANNHGKVPKSVKGENDRIHFADEYETSAELIFDPNDRYMYQHSEKLPAFTLHEPSSFDELTFRQLESIEPEFVSRIEFSGMEKNSNGEGIISPRKRRDLASSASYDGEVEDEE